MLYIYSKERERLPTAGIGNRYNPLPNCGIICVKAETHEVIKSLLRA
jgi:hypothetical protein